MQNEIAEFGKAIYNIAKQEIFPDVEERVKSFKDRVVNDILNRIPDNINFPINETIREFKTEVREFTNTPEPHKRKVVAEFIREEDRYKNEFKN